MNEFIIWDSKYKLFLDENFMDTLQDNGIDYEEDTIYYGDEYYPLCIMDIIMDYDCEPYKDRLSKLFYIGLNDINNNKIYADCSIVEFGYSVGDAVYIGYFYYDKEDLSYRIKILSSFLRNGISNKFKGQSFLFDRSMIDFKIIDTIQENKLRLIKE